MNSRFTNLMSLEQFATLALLDKWMFGGWCIADGAKCRCNENVFAEEMYQNRFVSRAEISQAIETAEQMIYQELGYFTAPVEIIGEKREYPAMKYSRSYKQRGILANSGMITRDGRDYKSLTLEHKFIQKIGTWSETELGEVSITLNPAQTIFTATYDLGSEPSGDIEYRAYFTETDRYDGEPKEQWEIRDLSFDVSGTILTITGGAYMLMKPELRQGRQWECVQILGDNFVDNILLYQRTFDNTAHGSLQWGVEPCTNGTGCNDTVVRDVCIQRDDTDHNPIVRPKPMSYSAETSQWTPYDITSRPDWVVINYVAGVPLVNGKVQKQYALPTYYLAASILRRDAPTCGCYGIEDDELKLMKEYEKVVLNEYDATAPNARISTERLVTQKKQLESAWGGRYGAVLAWNMIQSIKERDR